MMVPGAEDTRCCLLGVQNESGKFEAKSFYKRQVFASSLLALRGLALIAHQTATKDASFDCFNGPAFYH
jgi:hypothetical protein